MREQRTFGERRGLPPFTSPHSAWFCLVLVLVLVFAQSFCSSYFTLAMGNPKPGRSGPCRDDPKVRSRTNKLLRENCISTRRQNASIFSRLFCPHRHHTAPTAIFQPRRQYGGKLHNPAAQPRPTSPQIRPSVQARQSDHATRADPRTRGPVPRHPIPGVIVHFFSEI